MYNCKIIVQIIIYIILVLGYNNRYLESDGGYYEIDNILSANYWAGKNPNTLVGVTEDSWSLNGYDYSIIAEAHLSNISTMDIESIRTGNNPIDNNRSVPKFI